jgi:hypothetical protein
LSDGTPGAGTPSVVPISELADHLGSIVTIGGTVTSVSGAVATVEDASGTADVRLSDEAASLEAQLSVGDLVNVTGTVGRTPSGGIEVVVADPAGVVRLPASGETSAPQPTDPSPSAAAAVAVTTDDQEPTSDNRGPLIAVAVLLGLVGAALAAFAAVGPGRRARLLLWCTSTLAAARSRAARLRAQPDRG